MSDKKFQEIFDDSERLTQILQAGIYKALLKHKQAGKSICEWDRKQKKVVWIAPEDIPVNPKK